MNTAQRSGRREAHFEGAYSGDGAINPHVDIDRQQTTIASRCNGWRLPEPIAGGGSFEGA